MDFRIDIGYIGPADACLTLTRGGIQYEFLIEGTGWRILNRIGSLRTISKESPLYGPLEVIFDDPGSFGCTPRAELLRRGDHPNG